MSRPKAGEMIKMTHMAILVKDSSEEHLLKLREQIADTIHLSGARLVYSRISEVPLRILTGREGEYNSNGGGGG